MQVPAVVTVSLLAMAIGSSYGQLFVPEYCDWPTFPAVACTRMQFSTATSTPAGFRVQWQRWQASSSPPSSAVPFSTANSFRYVTTTGALDAGLIARAQSDLMSPSTSTLSLCLRFFYFISSDKNQLAVYFVEKSGATLTSTLVWQTPSSPQVGSWVRTFVPAAMTATTNQFYIQYEAVSTSSQVTTSAIARLSITYGQCYDIIEEDIILPPSTNTPLEYWPYSSPTIAVFMDTTFTGGPNFNDQNTALSTLMTNALSNLLPSLFESNDATCSLRFNFQRTVPSPAIAYLKIVREPSVNARICAAMLGPFSNAATEIHVTDNCFTSSNNETVLLHLFAHALGLKHQHRRADRVGALFLNTNAYDPIFQPFFDVDPTMGTSKSTYDLASVTQVGPFFLDQTDGRSPYGTLTSINGYAFGLAKFFSHYDLFRLSNLLGGPTSICTVRRVARCSALCYNGGVCSLRPKAYDDPGACLCRAGFSGQSCQLTSCFPPCQNGFCDPGNYCNCASASNLWTGFRCHIPISSVCTSFKCENGGTCVNSNGMQSCLCPPGYTGLMCQTPVCQQCTPGCPGDTTCISPNVVSCPTGTKQPFCSSCTTGYIGDALGGCKPYCSTNCSGNGQCSAPETCSCNVGWTGVTCANCISGYEYLCYKTTTLSPTCFPPCSQTGGYCSPLGVCFCFPGYEGVTCDRLSIQSTTPTLVRTSTTAATLFIPTTTQLIRCNPKQLIGVDQSQLYVRYVLSPYEVNFQVLLANGDLVTNERQSLEDFLNRALRDELNAYTEGRFMRLAIVNVCPGVVVDVLISYFTALNATTASRVVIQQARAIGVPLSDGKTALSRLDFDYIPLSQLSAVSVSLCTVYNDLNACKNGGTCNPPDDIGAPASPTVTFSPLMTPGNATWPTCQCQSGYSGAFCTDPDLPLPIWAIVAIAVGGILIIALSAVTFRTMCGSSRRQNHRQQRYQRSHPLPPAPPPMPGYVMVPWGSNQPGTLSLPHPGGAPYNIPVPLPMPAHSHHHQQQPTAMSIPSEPPPPYHQVATTAHPTMTIPRSQIRADEVDDDDFPTMHPQFSDLPPPPGYMPTSQFAHHQQPPPFMPRPPPRTSTADTRNRMMMKRPKLGR